MQMRYVTKICAKCPIWGADPTKHDGSNTDTTEGRSGIMSTTVLAPGLGKNSRSFAAIPYIYQPTTRTAGKVIENYRLYQKPLLTSAEVLLLIENVSGAIGNLVITSYYWGEYMSCEAYITEITISGLIACWITA